jgi:hypothetical protein
VILAAVRFLGSLCLAACLVLVAEPDAQASPWHNIDVAGSLPPLAFNMTDVATAHRAAVFRLQRHHNDECRAYRDHAEERAVSDRPTVW